MFPGVIRGLDSCLAGNQGLVLSICVLVVGRNAGGWAVRGKGYRGKCPDEVLKAENQFTSVTQSCPTLYDAMDCSTPGFPVHHQLPELTQSHVHQVSDATQPSHPLLSPSPPTCSLSQHWGLFK